MHAREREKGVGGQEGKKKRQRMANTSVVVVPHQKPQPRLCLPLVCVWRVCGKCGVCVDGVVTNGNHHCGTVAVVVCVMGLSGGGGSGKACQTNNTPWGVVVDVACVVAGKASGWRGVAATQCPHAHHQPPPWRPPPVPVCVCVWHKGRGGDHNTKAARQAPRLCLRCVCV